MFARSSTILARPSFIDDGIAHVGDVVMPALARMDGCTGLSMLVDRDAGKCIVTSSWQDRDAMEASEVEARTLHDDAATVFHATADTARWEVAMLRRHRPSSRRANVRVTWLQTDPAEMDRFIDTCKLALLPELQDLDGFCSASLLVDRPTGRAVSSVSFDSRPAMLATREADQTIWAKVVNETAARVAEVGEFDLAIAQLSLPEVV